VLDRGVHDSSQAVSRASATNTRVQHLYHRLGFTEDSVRLVNRLD
jgi:hypothetical protein